MVVHLEVFTNRATHALPRHRYAPDWTGRACRGVFMGAVPLVGVTVIVRVVDAVELLVVDPYRRGVRQWIAGSSDTGWAITGSYTTSTTTPWS